MLLIDVFDKPERFRFNQLGGDLLLAQDKALERQVPRRSGFAAPLGFLRAQASATVEARAPTYYRAADGAARLLLPMWGDGRIGMLLGAVQRRALTRGRSPPLKPKTPAISRRRFRLRSVALRSAVV